MIYHEYQSGGLFIHLCFCNFYDICSKKVTFSLKHIGVLKDIFSACKYSLTPLFASSGWNKSWDLPDRPLDGWRAVLELVKHLVPHV